MSSANNIQYHYIGQQPFLYKTGNTTKDGEVEYAWSRSSLLLCKLIIIFLFFFKKPVFIEARQGLTVSPLTDPGHIDTIYVVYASKVST